MLLVCFGRRLDNGNVLIRRMAACLRDMEIILRYVTYAVMAILVF